MSREMMTVWRVQSPEGMGIYAGAPDELGLAYSDAPERQPGPQRDGLPGGFFGLPPNARFGFASMGQCLQWFGRDTLRKAADYGFYVYCFRVPKERVLVGGHQVIFDQTAARKLNRVEVQA